MFFLAAFGAAHAADPLGEWRDEDGKATIRIVDCNSRLWGVIASESIPGGIDKFNPDKAKRTRPTLGIPVLLNMQKTADEKDKWEGKIYNATDGETYKASIQLKSANSLRVEGCVALILCGGQTWTRVAEAVPAPGGAKTSPGAAGAPKSAAPVPPAPASPPKTAATTPAPKAGAAKGVETASSDVCLLPEIAGAAH